MANCKGSAFTDHDFAADNRENLAGEHEWRDAFEKCQWERAFKIPCLTDDEGDLKIFFEDIAPSDIKQGQLGDCYFLCVLACLAERPNRIRKLFLDSEINEEGVYGVRMMDSGKIKEIVMDDYFPCHYSQPCFSQAKGNELWVMLLEKAYAKLHGSYERIEAGFPHNAMRDLTCCPSYYYSLTDMEE